MSSRVYVGNLSTRVTERELEGFFRPFGRIRDVMLKNGFGFVEFEDPRDAEDAVYEQNGRELCGERVVVELSRRERGFGGGFGGDFGGPPRGRGFGGGGGFHDRGFHGGFHGGGGGYGGRGGGGFRGGDGFRGRGGGGSARYGPPIQTRYRLLVYNLSTRCSWQDLKDLMRNAGDVTYADAHKRVRNEAIVCFASREDMRRAIDKYQGKDINGRRIKLVDDSEGYSGGEGRGGGGGGGSGRGSGGGGRRSRSRSPRSRSRSLRRSRSRTPPSRSASPAAVNGRSPSRSRSRSRTRSPSTEPSRKSGSPRA